MKHPIIVLVATAMAMWSINASAVLENIENAYESDVGHVMLPASAGGQVIVNECTGCSPVVRRVDAHTRYLIGEQPVTLAELRAAASKAGSKRMLLVFYHLESGLVTRIVLSAA